MLQVLRMVVSTYQAASGAGAAAMEELELQTREVWIDLFYYRELMLGETGFVVFDRKLKFLFFVFNFAGIGRKTTNM
jgi:aspartate-semialdehyde dehydrogenase